MSLKSFVQLAFAVVTFHLSATQIQAGTITVTYNGVNPGESVTISSPISAGTRAGVYNLSVTATTDVNFSVNDQLIAFCIDLHQGVSAPNSYTYTVGSLPLAPVGGPNPPGGMGTTRADLIRQLWTLHIASVTTDSGAAAFQLAVWEIINEAAPANAADIAAYSIGAGTFQATDAISGAAGTADSWLHGLSLSYNGVLANLASLQSETDQDFVVELPPPPDRHVGENPAPPGLVLGLVGAMALGGALAFRRRNRLIAVSV